MLNVNSSIFNRTIWYKFFYQNLQVLCFHIYSTENNILTAFGSFSSLIEQKATQIPLGPFLGLIKGTVANPFSRSFAAISVAFCCDSSK